MLKLWGRNNSSNVKKVMWACAELDIAYERIDAGGVYGGLDTEAFKAMNPMQLIPVIEHDGHVLWESNAIVRYLCATHPRDPFWPTDLKVRSHADRWMEFQATTLGPAQGPAFIQLVRVAPDKRDIKLITTHVERAASLWKHVDLQLSRTRWIAGEQMSFGDLPLGILIYTWDQLKLEEVGLAHLRVKHANLWRWYEQLQANKHFRDIVAIGLT